MPNPIPNTNLNPTTKQLKLPGFVINWICSCLSGRGQQCKVNGALSDSARIGLSIVQGCGIGQTL